MLNVDFYNRTYTAEVLRVRGEPDDALRTISRLTMGPRTEGQMEDSFGPPVKVFHSFVASKNQYNRMTRMLSLADGRKIEIPRRVEIRGDEHYQYDVLVALRRRHIVIAVPFHGLAEDFFVRVDRGLAGTRTLYERLNITNMVIKLGPRGVTDVSAPSSDGPAAICLTRCHLGYADPEGRSRHLQQLRMTGANLGASAVYEGLVGPVLNPKTSSMTVTPVILGFALSVDGAKTCGATTDRHGNFKLWISPGVRQLARVFGLLEAIEAMENVASTTTNVPILQSRAIKEAED